MALVQTHIPTPTPHPTARDFHATAWPVHFPRQTSLQEVLHADHAEERETTIGVLAASYYRQHKTDALRMAYCATSATVSLDIRTSVVKPWLHRCGSRLCPFCSRARHRHVSGQVEHAVNHMKHPRHVVLTLKSTPDALTLQLQHLTESFARLRRLPFWTRNVLHGIYTIEITLNSSTGLWHPHLHIIYDGSFIPVAQLKARWHEVTGNSDVVWIEQVGDRAKAIADISKYVGKPQASKHWPAPKLLEYATAIHGKRMIQCIGKRQPHAVHDADPNPGPPEELLTLSLARIVFRAAAGLPTPIRLATEIAIAFPVFASYVHLHVAPTNEQVRLQDKLHALMAKNQTPHQPGQPRHLLAALIRRYHLEEEQGEYFNTQAVSGGPDDG